MSTTLQEITPAPFLTEEDQELIQSTVEAIAHAGNLRLESGGSTYPLPPIVVRKIANLLNLMASGENVEIAPVPNRLKRNGFFGKKRRTGETFKKSRPLDDPIHRTGASGSGADTKEADFFALEK